MDRSGDQRDGQQCKATGCDGRRRSGRNHCQWILPISRDSCRDFDPSGPLKTAFDARLLGFKGYHPRYNVVIKKPASSKLVQNNWLENFILLIITVL